ncbi:DUF1353 domain-containing protein [Campylobacter fetus]|uniref:DUF1353 domain-containing protein n=1 Tax=Campylobacter fetus TaxID=196 RepID=UPI000FCB8FEC|nr:DUF1353 domain-containing protein [Campylobacter fetus]RUT50988.1 hypothetical protein BWK67_00245 [Campylobacter fetus]RUT51716.1 hypothetical protein BWK51_00245 [Campylobacter fetus]
MFLTDLVVKSMIGTNVFKLEKDLVYKNKSLHIVVPQNFVFDGTSVPKIITNLLPAFGYKYDRASCLHDWLYASSSFDRIDCDNIYFEALLSDKVNIRLAKIMYLAVRVFGAKRYGGDLTYFKVKGKKRK